MQIQTTPKPINYTLLWIAAILCAFLGGMLTGPFLLGAALKPAFHDTKNRVLSYHSVDSIVQEAYTSYLREDTVIKVELPDPDEIKIVKPTDCLKGIYTKATNTVVIEFNNPQNH